MNRERVQYLTKRWKYLTGAVMRFAGVVLIIIGVSSLIFPLYRRSVRMLDGMPDAISVLMFGSILMPFLWLLSMIVAFGALLMFIKRVPPLPYVPPVEEQQQIAALDDEGILLRGSDQPITLPAELLRAASNATASQSKQLLRPKDD